MCRGAWPGIGALTNLRELRVSGNRLAGLSAEVGSLRKLHRLVADNNALASIPGTAALGVTVWTQHLTHVLVWCLWSCGPSASRHCAALLTQIDPACGLT